MTGIRRRCRCSSTPRGRARRRTLLMLANRNGFFYVLDRVTGKFLLGKPFIKQNWASGLDENGRPIQTPQPPGATTWPGQQGGTNWYSPSYSPRTGLFYVSAWEDMGGVYTEPGIRLQARRQFHGRRIPDDAGDARGPRAAEHPASDPQQLDRRRRPRRGDRDRSRDRRTQVDVPDVRPDGFRHPDDGVGSRSSPAAATDTSRRSTPAPARCCGRAVSARCRCCPGRSLIRSTAGSTSRPSAATSWRRTALRD